MRTIHLRQLDAVSALVAQKTAALDVERCEFGSYAVGTVGLAGTVSAQMQQSNQVPPGYGTANGWKPDETSWFNTGSPSSITTDTTTCIITDVQGLMGRWVRLALTPTAVTAGTISVDVVMKGGA